MSLEMRIALGALCTFNAVMLLVLAGLSYEYVDGGAGLVGAILLITGSIALFVGGHLLRPYRNG